MKKNTRKRGLYGHAIAAGFVVAFGSVTAVAASGETTAFTGVAILLFAGYPFEYTSHAIGTIIDGAHVSDLKR